ncbi:MAG: hypothetical protein AB7U20_20525 [Planctomycetaceae bacterium]
MATGWHFVLHFHDRREVEVGTGPDNHQTCGAENLQDGGRTLPGFAVRVAETFAGLELEPPADEDLRSA